MNRAYETLRDWLGSYIEVADKERENRAKETDRCVEAQRWARRWKLVAKKRNTQLKTIRKERRVWRALKIELLSKIARAKKQA